MAEDKPWHEAFPQPKNQSPSKITKEALLSKLNAVGKQSGVRDFLLVDVRRNDHEGGTIAGSLNLPAQSLYHSLPTLLSMCQRSGTQDVIWYCGSSRGRGPRCASWFDDCLMARGEQGIRSLVLEGGVKGWAVGGDEYTSMMDGYEAKVWKRGQD